MKYIILFLISFNLYAIDFNVKVQHYKNSSIEREFNGTAQEAQAWLVKAENIMPKLGYKPQRFHLDTTDNPISASDLSDHNTIQCWDRAGVVITYRACTKTEVVVQEFQPATQIEELDIDGNPTGQMIDVPEVPEIKAFNYELPATYKLIINDITAEVEAKKAKKDAEEASCAALNTILKTEDLKVDQLNTFIRNRCSYQE